MLANMSRCQLAGFSAHSLGIFATQFQKLQNNPNVHFLTNFMS